MDELSIKDLWARTMAFDQSQWSAVDPEGAQALEGWLVENPSAWLNEMRRPPIDRTHGECVFVVVGEAGSGKSTLLEIIRTYEIQNGNLPIRFDFKNAPRMVGKEEPRQLLESLYSMMKSKVQLAAASSGRMLELKAAKMRQALTSGTDEFIDWLIKVPGIDEMSDENLLAYEELHVATQEYEKAVPDAYITLMAAQFLASAGRTTFLVDNIEGLPARARRYLFELLTTLQAGRTVLVVAIRSEHQRDAQLLYQGRPSDPYHLAQERKALIELAVIRNDGAKRFGLAHLPHESSKIVQHHKNFEESLEVVQSGDFLFSLFTGWLNGNVRDFLTLLAEMSAVLPNLRGRSLKGFISSYLVVSRSHSSLQRMFDPRRIWTSKYKSFPFVYLPLRILAYLENRGGSVSKDDLLGDFEEAFGIGSSDINGALESMEKEEAGKPSLCRQELRDSGDRVHLLPCGETFVREVVFECDYLMTLFDRIENPPVMPTGMGYSEQKLRKSIAVIDHLILPGFTAEHPYVKPRTPIKQSTRDRLKQYEKLFSWRQGHWFIGILRVRLRNYAKERDLLDIAASTLDQLSTMERRLDHVAGGGRR